MRKQELEDFNKKTETKVDLFNELKKMDEDLKKKQTSMAGDQKSVVDAEKRIEMYRKLRKDMDDENRQEKEAAYQRRSEEMDEKEKLKEFFAS